MRQMKNICSLSLFISLLLVVGACFQVSFSDPLYAYQGCTTDSALVQKQYAAVQNTIKERYASDPKKVPDLSHPINATQTFTFDSDGKVTTCWAFEFHEPAVGEAPIYHNVLLVVNGEGYYYAYDEMLQPRKDQYLRLSAVKSGEEWKPATFYIEPAWKCVGYESCNRYGSKLTSTREWNSLLEKAKEMGIELDMSELPLVKEKKDNK